LRKVGKFLNHLETRQCFLGRWAGKDFFRKFFWRGSKRLSFREPGLSSVTWLILPYIKLFLQISWCGTRIAQQNYFDVEGSRYHLRLPAVGRLAKLYLEKPRTNTGLKRVTAVIQREGKGGSWGMVLVWRRGEGKQRRG
jgi:hypothetical protein